MREDGGADGAGPHPEAGSQLAGHLRVAAEVLAEAALVNVELPAHGARVVGASPLSCTVHTQNFSTGASQHAHSGNRRTPTPPPPKLLVCAN